MAVSLSVLLKTFPRLLIGFSVIDGIAVGKVEPQHCRIAAPSQASRISWVISPVCSMQHGTFGIPPFYTVVSIYSFCRRNSVMRRATILKNIFLSTMRSEMTLNCSILLLLLQNPDTLCMFPLRHPFPPPPDDFDFP